ncbi:ferredoxin reductase, partial [Pseudomonas sp. GW704-F3]|uniref:FAD-dependent oxidoreductase n=1 Tax=Pseudomonas sp. GW704-F3 TaxID=2070574 RepID=UPI000CC28BEC
ACEALSSFFQTYHTAKGVVFEVSAQVERLTGVDGRIAGVVLADGRTLPCDVALVGVGAMPNQEIAKAAGVVCDQGVVVDLEARTSD